MKTQILSYTKYCFLPDAPKRHPIIVINNLRKGLLKKIKILTILNHAHKSCGRSIKLMHDNRIKKERDMKKITEAEIFKIQLPAKAKYAAIVRTVSVMIAHRMGFQISSIEDIRIAVGEAVVNIIWHAYDDEDKSNQITARYLIYPDKLVVVIHDFGKGFDYRFTQLYFSRKKEGNKGGNLGIRLIETLMDEVEYDSNLKKGTEVRMTKYRTENETRSN